jgi:cyclophilin family peptidyl-prolyl cis-trans isomerase/HEAT repeat protein
MPATRVNVLAAEDRRAPNARDLATLRAAARGPDAQTTRLAVRALGRLERPDLVPDIAPSLRNALPEIRAEAANALAQAARGWAGGSGSPGRSPAAGLEWLQATLIERLKDDGDASVRAALAESLGRLPSRSAEQAATAEAALLQLLNSSETVTDRLGAAKGLEAFVRATRSVRPPSADAIAALNRLAEIPPAAADAPAGRLRFDGDPLRDARVRRLAIEALILLNAADARLVAQAERDPDPQVRRLAMRAALTVTSEPPNTAVFVRGLEDPAAMVRLEALRGIRERGGSQTCAASLAALGDRDAHVALLALDQLASCGSWREAVIRLEEAVTNLGAASSPRGWHRAAHAGVALALALPERARALLGHLAGSSVWQLRMYAARAATILKDRQRLEELARDANDNVVEAAIEGLRAVAGHESDAVYLAAIARSGYQAVRMAGLALAGSPNAEIVVPALKAALERLDAEGHQNSVDTRTALRDALTGLAPPPAPAKPSRSARGAATRGPVDGARPAASSVLDGEALRRLASPRARITMAGIGVFEIALFTAEAPATVLQFAALADSGYYNGLSFHRVLANFVIQGGSPGANEYVGFPSHMRDEVGLWPHVRGAVGISTRGRDTGDAQIFINLVDNPRLDHQYTVFAQVLNGMDIVDRILEGDVIERVEILP